ncbi:MAG: glycosyltransferase family 2 protein [Acidobacteriaceae bacterium]
MRAVFWLCLALVGYAYFGYPLLLWLQARWLRSLSPQNQRLQSHMIQNQPFQDESTQQPIAADHSLPSVSILLAARNEEANLPAKIENLKMTAYPWERLQIVIASDGSTDRTAEILREHLSVLCPVLLDQSRGKAVALNEAVKHATGEVLVFQDARQMVDSNAVAELVSRLTDPEVGAVSGELLLEPTSSAVASEGLGIYWKIEKMVRKLESETGSVVGVTGAIYAVRRELFTEIPAGTILDDVFVPMRVLKAGRRVVFQSTAIARDRFFSQKGKEFSRKVRTLTGNYQLLRLEPWLLSTQNPVLFRFVCHKLLRLVVPLFLALMLIAAAIARGSLYHAAFVAQILFYLAAAFGAVTPSAKAFKPIAIAHTFVLLNAAALMAFYSFVAGRKRLWT